MQESKDKKRFEGFATGRKKNRIYPPGGIKYYVNRVSAITGYRKTDVEIVLKCFSDVLDECLIEASEDVSKGFTFGPIEIFGKSVNRDDYWQNPKTGELVKLEPHVLPSVRIRPAWKSAFTISQKKQREVLGVDLDGKQKRTRN